MKATEDIPYPASVHHAMHLPRLEALVRLMGVNAPASGTARVLELGCAYGTSLLALAEMLPHADFLGLDIDGAAIREAEATALAAGISNARFLETEDMPAAVAGREFDYILVHGLFSWVTDEVKEQIFSIFRDTLAPNGSGADDSGTHSHGSGHGAKGGKFFRRETGGVHGCLVIAGFRKWFRMFGIQIIAAAP